MSCSALEYSMKSTDQLASYLAWFAANAPLALFSLPANRWRGRLAPIILATLQTVDSDKRADITGCSRVFQPGGRRLVGRKRA